MKGGNIMNGNVLMEFLEREKWDRKLNGEDIPYDKVVELTTSEVCNIFNKLQINPKDEMDFLIHTTDLISEELKINEDEMDNVHEYLNFLLYCYYIFCTEKEYEKVNYYEKLHFEAYPFIVEEYRPNGDLVCFKQFRTLDEAIEYFEKVKGYGTYLREYLKDTLVYYSWGQYKIDKIGLSKKN